jgi:hypothetical protein
LNIASRQDFGPKKSFDNLEKLSIYFVINNIKSHEKEKRIACVYYYHSGDGARQTAPVSMTLMTMEYLGMYFFFFGGGQQKIQNPGNFLS